MRHFRNLFALAAVAALFALIPGDMTFAGSDGPEFGGRDDKGLLPMKVQQAVGKRIDFSQTTAGGIAVGSGGTLTTTYDVYPFGFVADYVRLCIHSQSNPVYIRFGTTGTTSPDVMNTSAAGNRLTVPVSTPTAFIHGNATFTERAMPFTALPASANFGTSLNVQLQTYSQCTTQPWNTPGLVVHVSTGLATVDVWGMRSGNRR